MSSTIGPNLRVLPTTCQSGLLLCSPKQKTQEVPSANRKLLTPQYRGVLCSPPWGLPLHVKQLEKLPSCPWEWWDCRPEKMNVRYLDFKPKKTKDGNWVLKTNKTLHGWCLPWHQHLYNCTIFHGIEGLQAMLRLGNMRRQFELFLECHTWRMCHAFTQLLQN